VANNREGIGMLSPYRVLDLTDEKGFLCGKLLGDLGADVIKIERPGGNPARNIGPFYHDEVDPEKSLFWFAFNTSMRGVTLDIEKPEGKKLFKRLVETADVIIESFPPGHMDKLGLGYSDLEQVNPRIVMVSITAFGQTGPYRNYKTCDIVAWAMGGYLYVYGDVDRPPIRISHHSHAYLHTAGEAATGALMALYHREVTGEGQHVDVSVHESSARLDMTHKWDMTRVFLRRGEWLGPVTFRARYIWPCKDGYVMWQFWVGPAAALWTMPFIKWMEEEGVTDDFIKGIKWVEIDTGTEEGARLATEVLSRIEGLVMKFFSKHTKKELDAEAKKRGVMLYPVADVKDVLESGQLASRDFWRKVEHPELGTSIVYPGPFTRCSEADLAPRVFCRAPLIGEHNEEIYIRELGISRETLSELKQAGIV
jgi:crotonobetainyl-CoA:carnitine CoA-transferase CaiB-like acyl-CoA transferase